MPHTNPYVPRDVGLRLRAAVRRQLSEPSSCVPAGAVMLSAVNSEQAALRKLALSKVAHLDCLMHRFITLVWDHDGDESGSSVRAASPSIPVSSSSLYHYLTWSKWFVLSSALVHARAALFVDADVLLLRNPFSAPELSWLWREERSDDGPRLPLLLHQFEGHGGSPFNSGQLLVTSLAHHGTRPHRIVWMRAGEYFAPRYTDRDRERCAWRPRTWTLAVARHVSRWARP